MVEEHPVSDDPAPGYVRVRLDLAYDGADFSGWNSGLKQVSLP